MEESFPYFLLTKKLSDQMKQLTKLRLEIGLDIVLLQFLLSLAITSSKDRTDETDELTQFI